MQRTSQCEEKFCKLSVFSNTHLPIPFTSALQLSILHWLLHSYRWYFYNGESRRLTRISWSPFWLLQKGASWPALISSSPFVVFTTHENLVSLASRLRTASKQKGRLPQILASGAKMDWRRSRRAMSARLPSPTRAGLSSFTSLWARLPWQASASPTTPGRGSVSTQSR